MVSGWISAALSLELFDPFFPYSGEGNLVALFGSPLMRWMDKCNVYVSCWNTERGKGKFALVHPASAC